MKTKIRAAILATVETEPYPIKPFMLKGWLERPDSLVRHRCETRVFRLYSVNSLDSVFGLIGKYRPDFLLFYSNDEWPETLLLPKILSLRSNLPQMSIAITNDSVVKISELSAGKYGINYIFRGESFRSIEKILVKILSEEYVLPEKPEIIYDYGNLKNIDSIPSAIIGNKYLSQEKELHIYMGHGCTNHCGYCALGEISPRFFKKERVVDELEYAAVNAVKSKTIKLLATDLFSADTSYIIPVARELAKKYNKKFVFYTHAGFFHSEKTLSEANSSFFRIAAGVQSFNTRSLASVQRAHDVNAIRENLLRIRKYAPKANLCVLMILGLPYETEQSWLSGLEWLICNKFDILINHLFINPESMLAESPIGKRYCTMPEMPYYALSTNVLDKKEFGKMLEKTRKIFMILNLLKASNSLYKAFYSIAARNSYEEYPHVSVALSFAKRLLSDEETKASYKNYLSYNSPYTIGTFDRDFFSKCDIINAARVLISLVKSIP